MCTLDGREHGRVSRQLSSVQLRIPSAYVKAVHLRKLFVVHRAEGNDLCACELHQLQVVPVVEVEGLVQGYADLQARALFVSPVEIRLWSFQGLGLGSNIEDTVDVQAFLHDLAYSVQPLDKPIVPGLAFKHRHQSQMSHGKVHGLVPGYDAHDLHACVPLDLFSRLPGVPLTAHFVQDDPLYVDQRIEVHVALDKSCSRTGYGPGVHNEDHRGLQDLGDLGSRSEVALVSFVKAAHPFDHRNVCVIRCMGIDLVNRPLGHEVAVQVSARPSSDPAMIGRVDVVHRHLEGLDTEAAATQS